MLWSKYVWFNSITWDVRTVVPLHALSNKTTLYYAISHWK